MRFSDGISLYPAFLPLRETDCGGCGGDCVPMLVNAPGISNIHMTTACGKKKKHMLYYWTTHLFALKWTHQTVFLNDTT